MHKAFLQDASTLCEASCDLGSVTVGTCAESLTRALTLPGSRAIISAISLDDGNTTYLANASGRRHMALQVLQCLVIVLPVRARVGSAATGN